MLIAPRLLPNAYECCAKRRRKWRSCNLRTMRSATGMTKFETVRNVYQLFKFVQSRGPQAVLRNTIVVGQNRSRAYRSYTHSRTSTKQCGCSRRNKPFNRGCAEYSYSLCSFNHTEQIPCIRKIGTPFETTLSFGLQL